MIHRCEPQSGNVITQWSVSQFSELGLYHFSLSLTPSFNVLAAVDYMETCRQIREYSPDGKIIREINLDSSMQDLHHGILLANDKFIVCHGDKKKSQCRVCIVDINGHVVESYGGAPGSGVGQMKYPRHMAAYKHSCVFIADSETIRVELLSPSLTHLVKLIIDLSVPCNTEAAAQQLPGIQFVDVDELSKLKDKTLAARKAEVPMAKAIIEKHIADFTEWYDMRKHVPVLKAVKTKLEQIQTCSLYNQSNPASYTFVPEKAEYKIQQVVSGMATKMRKQNQKGCYYIEAINEFIADSTD